MKMVLITLPESAAASLLTRLVEERLVACGNIVPGVRSIYRWEGEVCDDTEAVVVMETGDDRIDAAMARIADLHPYDCPKIVAWTPTHVHAGYLSWVQNSTRIDTQES